MLYYHKKVVQMLKDQQCSCPSRSRLARPKPPFAPVTPEAPIEGRFDQDDDLGQDPYDPLKTPTDTLIQDKNIMPVQDENVTPVQDKTLSDPTMSNTVT